MLLEEEDDNEVTIVEDKDDYVLDKSLLSRFENTQHMWRLTNSTRESSLVSDYSYDFKRKGGYTSDDMASLIGSTALTYPYFEKIQRWILFCRVHWNPMTYFAK